MKNYISYIFSQDNVLNFGGVVVDFEKSAPSTKEVQEVRDDLSRNFKTNDLVILGYFPVSEEE